MMLGLVLQVHSSAGSHIMPLSFRAADPASPGSRRRRLATGHELHGNLHTLGYFSADVCLGTPEMSFDLIVDTGSALTALPCVNCPACGEHAHSAYSQRRYDASKSSTGSIVPCSSDQCTHHRCEDQQQCAYSVSYTEGSSIRGHMVSETFWFSSASRGGQRVPVPAVFGCQEFESGLFKSQVADGITGFSRGSGFGATLFESLKEAERDAHDAFSICLSQSVGAMVLGGRPPTGDIAPPVHLRGYAGGRIDWIPMSAGSSYSIALVDITIDGNSIGTPRQSYHSTIVDTGTTFMYLPTAAYNRVRDHWRGNCPWGNCADRVAAGEYPDDYCYTMSHDEMLSFSPHALVFENGVSVSFGPRQYAYELRRGVWCLGVFDNEHSGAVIGGACIRDYEVIFDMEHNRLGFVPSDCEAMHAGTHPSVLEGGYGLAGCGASSGDAKPPGDTSGSVSADPTTPAGAPPSPLPSPSQVPGASNATPGLSAPGLLPSKLPGGGVSVQIGGGDGSVSGRGRERASNHSGYLVMISDESWLLSHTTSWAEFAQTLETLHPGAVAAIAVGSTLLCCLSVLGACCLRMRFKRLAKEYDERIRLFGIGQELSAFDTDERAAVAAEAAVPSGQFATTLVVNGKEYDPDL